METSVSFAALFISLCAFAVTIYQSYLTRKHNRLSVKPILTLDRFLDLDERSFSVTLENFGVGPAVIDTFTMKYRGQVIHSFEPQIVQLAFADNVLAIGNFKHYVYQSGEAVGAAQTKLILQINFLDTPSFTEAKCKDILKNLTLSIEYSSIYSDRFTLNQPYY